ncbi:MAG: 23S rRNA (pseudouridine(1915)-N(3))-methyltransferase RlmH, partial [Pseudomonadota bacterium]
MKIRLLAVGRKMPAWVTDGFNEYRKRLPRHLSLELKEISPGRRGPGLDPAAAIAAESTALTRACRGAALTIALDERGEAIDSP